LTTFIVALLYVGREVLIPMSLAALLTFLLAPAVTRLERWLGRIGAVILVMLMIIGATVAAGWTLGSQAVNLANGMPAYKSHIQSKLQSFKIPSDGPWSRLSSVIEDLKKDAPGGEKKEAADAQLNNTAKNAKSGGKDPIPVEVVQTPDTTPFQIAKSMVAPVVGPLGTTGLVLLLLVFMLLKREDLRGRFVRLVGQGRISSTTKVMDDAGARIRRYLLMQLVVNVTYGIPLAVGLYFIGVPNALLWGVVAMVLRFIPYIGPWIAAFFPITLSLVVSDSWAPPLLTLGLFVVIELISNNLLEPWLYGSSTGVSSIALIIAAVFWTWMWGTVGLILATPITVCLVVMGRHIPQLTFLSILLSEEEALTPAEDCYHRMLRNAEHDETELVDSFLKAKSPTELYDAVLIPVALAAERDHRHGMLDHEQKDRVIRSLGEVVEDLSERYALSAMETQSEDSDDQPLGYPLNIQILPARAERDVLAGSMLSQSLSQKGFTARNASSRKITSEMISALEKDPHDLVCISVMAPSSAVHARNLLIKLHRAVPDQPLVVGLWGRTDDITEDAKNLREAGAEEVFRTVAEMVAYCERFSLQLEQKTQPAPVPEDEEERQATLDSLGILSDEREPLLDHITSKLARVFEVPTAAITLLDHDRQFFKSGKGLPGEMDEERETPRDLSVCGHVVAADQTLIIPDLKRDRRFAGNPLLNKHHIRFYAGVPIRASNGQAIGALCLMDTSPRRFTKQEVRMLTENAVEVAEEIERLAGVAIPE
jgi:predicted PurR-regulated permease PerM